MKSERDDAVNQLFISYCSKNKQIVLSIADELQKLKYDVWIDRDLVPGIHLYTEIANGLNNSHIFICFISKDYCKSACCLKELSLAHDLRKRILPIMLERDVCNGVDLLVSNVNRFEAFKKDDKLEPWSQSNFEKLNKLINQVLTNVCFKCAGTHPIKSDSVGIFKILFVLSFFFT